MSQHIPTSEVLYRAADDIERYGHFKGGGFAGHGSVDEVAACAIGAINRAAGFNGSEDVTLKALRLHLGSTIVVWNDAPERTAEEVVAAFRACAVIEAAKENADVRESVTVR